MTVDKYENVNECMPRRQWCLIYKSDEHRNILHNEPRTNYMNSQKPDFMTCRQQKRTIWRNLFAIMSTDICCWNTKIITNALLAINCKLGKKRNEQLKYDLIECNFKSAWHGEWRQSESGVDEAPDAHFIFCFWKKLEPVSTARLDIDLHLIGAFGIRA